MLHSYNGTIGHIIATGKDGRRTFISGEIEESIGADASGGWLKIAFQHQAGVENYARLVQGIAITLVAVM